MVYISSGLEKIYHPLSRDGCEYDIAALIMFMNAYPPLTKTQTRFDKLPLQYPPPQESLILRYLLSDVVNYYTYT